MDHEKQHMHEINVSMDPCRATIKKIEEQPPESIVSGPSSSKDTAGETSDRNTWESVETEAEWRSLDGRRSSRIREFNKITKRQ